MRIPVFRQLKDSLSALIEWVGGPARKASSMTTTPVSLLQVRTAEHLEIDR